MLRVGFIVLTLVCAPIAAFSQQVADQSRFDIFVDAIWNYVEQRCPEAVSISEDTNGEIRDILLEREAEWSENSDDPLEYVSSDRYRHVLAMAAIGAYSVVQQLGFQDEFFDQPSADDDRISRREAEASVELMDCVMPTMEELRARLPSEIVDEYKEEFDVRNIDEIEIEDGLAIDLLWTFVVSELHQGNCKIEMTVLTRRFIDADVTGLDAEERLAIGQQILVTHQAYLNDRPADAPCEVFKQ